MATVLAHCYGCNATTPVFADSMAAGLRATGWVAQAGKTYCPTCAAELGLAPGPTPPPDADPTDRAPLVRPDVLAAPEPPMGTAIKDPATRASLNRYRTSMLLWLLVGAVLLVPSIAVVRKQEARADYLLAHGTRTPGEVVGLGYRGRNDYLLVRYRVADVMRDGRINVGDRYDYYNGEDLTVIYDPAHPSRIRTPEVANRPTSTTRPLMYGFIFGAVALLGGFGVYRRGMRWRSVLAERDWELVRSQCTVPPGGRRVATFELSRVAEPDAAAFRVQLGGLPWRTRKLVNRTSLWFAGGPASGAVLCIPETRELFSATLRPISRKRDEK